MSHLVGPVVLAQTLQSQNVPGRDGVKIVVRSGPVFLAVSPWGRPGPQTVANTASDKRLDIISRAVGYPVELLERPRIQDALEHLIF